MDSLVPNALAGSTADDCLIDFCANSDRREDSPSNLSSQRWNLLSVEDR